MGEQYTRLYKTWSAMKDRCCNTGQSKEHLYWGVKKS